MEAIMTLDAVLTPRPAHRQLRDALAQLYCMCATLFCGATVTVSPQEQRLSALVWEVSARLDECGLAAGDAAQAIRSLRQLVGAARALGLGC
jgi:hypothetical protein